MFWGVDSVLLCCENISATRIGLILVAGPMTPGAFTKYEYDQRSDGKSSGTDSVSMKSVVGDPNVFLGIVR